ncbi:alpha/beta fold hydrolase [Nocardia sp. NPDC057227]|uniref:alpha/beta fold hydrolase n=1 Tax=Nocardia sp. NPDC057227 TaxID=3346056 RepID=UPI00362D246C
MALTRREFTAGEVTMRVTEAGSGPPVIFCHGFPHTGYIWHRQLSALAAAGYHALAPDLRGAGGTPCPPSGCANREVIGDLLALLDDIGAERAVFAGLDFGAALVWELAWRAPERISGLIVLNNVFQPRPPKPPSELWARAARKHFLHLDYFQREGPADAELNSAPRDFLARVYFALSADYHYFDTWRFPPENTGYLDVLPAAPPLPWSWLATEELDTLAAEFTRTGFTGGLGWYRALDRNWALTEEFAGRPVTVPTYFLYGDRDPDIEGFSGRDPFGTMREHVPGLRRMDEVTGAGHLVQLERTDEVNALLLRYLAEL